MRIRDWTTRKAKQLIREYKRTHACSDCGVFWPWYVTEFDHVLPQTKNFTIGRGRLIPEQQLRYEMALCDLVCRNCHAEREHQRGRTQ